MKSFANWLSTKHQEPRQDYAMKETQTEADAMNQAMTSQSNDQRAQVRPRAGRAGTDHDRDVPEIDLLSPLTLRGVTFRNRIAMSPMCQYSARGWLCQ